MQTSQTARKPSAATAALRTQISDASANSEIFLSSIIERDLRFVLISTIKRKDPVVVIDKELPAEAPTLMEDRYVARVQWLHYNQPAYKLYTQLFGVFIQRKCASS